MLSVHGIKTLSELGEADNTTDGDDRIRDICINDLAKILDIEVITQWLNFLRISKK